MAAEDEEPSTTQLDADSRYAELPEMRQQIVDLQADIADGVTQADVDQDPAVVDLQRRARRGRGPVRGGQGGLPRRARRLRRDG